MCNKINSLVLCLLIEEEEEGYEEEILLLCKNNAPTDHLFLHREEEGAFAITVKRRLMQNEKKFQEYFRLSRNLFSIVLNQIREDITRKPTNRFRNPITPEEKLCITLRYLATGESFRSLAFQYRVNHSWISIIVREVLKSIRRRMLNMFLPKPTEDTLKNNISDFYQLWNYPNCFGAIDGKHIRIVCPDKAGSLFYNYKNFHSVVMLALVDAKCRFVAIEVGSYGREGDAAIFKKSILGKQIDSGRFNIPPPQVLPNTDILQPNVILGDEAFSLTTSIMKPYPKKQSSNDETKAIYNYRHSRARRTTENAFGILCQYFRVFYTPIAISTEAIDDAIISACILHNMLRNSRIPYPGEQFGNIDHPLLQMPTHNLLPLSASNDRRACFEALEVRNAFRLFFNSVSGSVSWQKRYI